MSSGPLSAGLATGLAALTLAISLTFGAPTSAQQAPAEDRPALTPLWPNGAPGAKGIEPADIPAFQLYRAPAEKANGAGVVVCPGGGYGGLADHEGYPIAKWLNSIGVTAIVLKYRLGPKYQHPAPLQDASRAVRLMRAKAGEWGVDPRRVGIIGFSAGGHLASTVSTHFDGGNSSAADPIDRQSSRPDFSLLIYPVITFGEYTHQGSKRNLLGPNPSQELVDSLSNERQVTKETPPAFLVHSFEDTAVPPENSIYYYLALRKAGVPAEMHIFEKGRHGFGLGDRYPEAAPMASAWPKLCENWMRGRGFIK